MEIKHIIEFTTQRTHFHVRGSYGYNGGIVLAKEYTRFFNTLRIIKTKIQRFLDSKISILAYFRLFGFMWS